MSLLELFDSELLSESLLSLLFEFELLSSSDLDFDFSDLEDSFSDFLETLCSVSLFLDPDFFDFLIDELILELFASEILLDFELEALDFFEDFEIFELFFFSSDLIELDFF